MSTQNQNATTNVLRQIQSKDVKSQEKYGFTVKDGRDQIPFGPFDTKDAASKTAKSLTESGLTVSDVHVIWTVSTARALAAVRRAQMPKVEDVKSETEPAAKAG